MENTEINKLLILEENLKNIVNTVIDHEKRLRVIEKVLYLGVGGLYVLQTVIIYFIAK